MNIKIEILIDNKGISNKRFGGLYENHNYNNHSTINDSLYQIDEVQTNNTNNNTNSNINTIIPCIKTHFNF